MTLSPRTIDRLAEAMAPEVVKYIFEDERFSELLMEIIPDAVSEKLGEVDDNIRFDLYLAITERVTIRAV